MTRRTFVSTSVGAAVAVGTAVTARCQATAVSPRKGAEETARREARITGRNRVGAVAYS